MTSQSNMSNCHQEFLKFNKVISLTANEVRKLERSRDAVKSRIVSHFIDKRYKAPEFKGQGSFTMGTSIRPVEGFYDLDMGVYLIGLGTDRDNWPRTETIQNLIFNAVDGHTSIRPVRKTACVRVIYRSPYVDKTEISYHIDLPIYAIEQSFWRGTRTVIGMKGDAQWSESSDPQQFTKWFFEMCNKNQHDSDQLKRIVKYLKAWKENQPASPRMPSGMILTVLAAKNFKPHQRDDVALVDTVDAFVDRLGWQFSIIKPTAPKNDLSESLSKTEEDNFMDRAEKFLKLANNALEARKPHDSIRCWKRIFGQRFGGADSAKLIS